MLAGLQSGGPQKCIYKGRKRRITGRKGYDRVWRLYGTVPKNLESKLRRILKRVKSNSISDPVTKGKIINATGGRWAHFCCDTGSSVNLMPAKMAAAGGLKWRPIDEDEPTYKSVTNEELEIVG